MSLHRNNNKNSNRQGTQSFTHNRLSPAVVYKKAVFACAFLMTLIVFSTPTFANPVGGQVTAGSATITNPSANTVQINQTSQKAAINWQSFNIGAHERTHFQQPAGGVALNRISPTQGASQIYGQLTATGQVILVNPAGIYFGPSAYVNVGGLIATTATMTDQQFMSGQFQFTKVPGYSGAIVNEGQIIAAQNGLIALVAPSVINKGLIQANLGKMVIASGEAFTINFSGDNMINFSIDQATSRRGVDKDGNPLPDGVRNSGTIVADGGQVYISAKAAAGVLDHVINMDGIVQARSVQQHNGEIIFTGGESGVVRIAGKVDASGRNAGERGGKIHITGENVLLNNATLDVSGDQGAGEILIGGDYQGHGTLANAQASVIDSGSMLYADALSSGNGGKVIVWADQVTKFYGTIFARAGVNGGNGGFIETSGKAYLEAMGTVIANAAAGGAAGVWLLDPANVTISGAVTLNGLFDGLVPNTFSTTANSAIANVVTIIASLNLGTSVTILTTPAGTQAGDITLSSAITKTLSLTTPTLTLNAAGSIILNNSISSTLGGLDVVLTAGSNITIGSAAASAISTNGGNFTANAQNTITMSTGANAGTIDAGAGTVSISANQDGAGTNAFTMAANSSITTTNTTSSAVNIVVNSTLGGTGTAALRNITTGNGGTITVQTNPGANTTGGSITMPAGTLDVGTTGTINLLTSQIAGRAIGTVGTTMQIKAANLNATTGSGGLFITNTGTSGLDLGTLNTTGAFTLNSTTSTGITDSGTQTVVGVLTVVAGAGQDITLDSAANNFGTATITSGNNVSLLDTNALILGASTISGNYNVTAGGTITETGALAITGTPTFTLTTAATDLSLASQANTFTTTPVITSNGNIRDLLLRNTLASAVVPVMPTGLRNVTLTFNNAGMVLPTLALTGTLTATANGSITQTGALTGITTGTFVAGAANDVNLVNISNDFGAVAVTSGNNVSLVDANALNIGNTTVSGTLNITTNGTLADTGTLNITGLTTLTAGTTSTISFNSAGNDFSAIKVISGNNVTLRDTNALILDGITTNGTLSLTTNGALTQTGVITAGGTTTLAVGVANDATLTNPANNFTSLGVTSGNNISVVDLDAIGLGAATVAGNYSITAGGNITQSGVLNITGTPTFTVTSAASNISLASQANNFATTPVIIDNGNVQDLLLRNTNSGALVPTLPTGLHALTLTFNNASSMVLPGFTLTGNLSVTANGPITQSGTLIVNGIGTTATFVAGAANDITLNDVNNDFVNTAFTSGNNVSVTDVNALTLGTSTVSGTYNVTINGALIQSGTQIVTGLTTLSAGTANNITLATAANNFSAIKVLTGNNISLRDTNALVIDGISANGTLQLQTNGLLSQTAGITALGTTTLIAGPANNILFTNTANDFSNVAVTSGNNVSLTDANALALGTSTISGTYDVIAGDSITQTGILNVTGIPTFTVSAANSDISLASQANVFSSTPVITNNGNVRDLLLRNTSATAVVPVLPTGMRNLTLTFNAAAMALPAVTLTGSLTATASGVISQTGALTGTSLIAKTLNNAGSAITLFDAGNEFTSVDIRSRNGADSANAAGAISYADASGFDITALATTSTINLNAGNAITQTGTIVGTTLTAKTLKNGGADITLANAGNALTAINLASRNALDTVNTAGNLTYRDLNTLDVAGIGTTGTANIIATALTQSGSIIANSLIAKTLNNAGGVITFGDLGNDVNSIDLRARNAADTANDTGAIIYTDANDFDVATIGTASTANLNAGGAITDSGNITATTLTTNSIGGTVLDFGSNVTSFNATNITSGNIDFVNTGALSVTGISLAGGGNFILNNTGTTTITGVVNTDVGNTSITSTGTVADSTTGAITTNVLSVKTLNDVGAAITLDNIDLHNPAVINLQARNATDTANAAGAIIFRDADGFDVSGISTSSTVSLTGLGTMTQSGMMTGSTLTATTLNDAGAAITFNDSGNLLTNINLQSRNAANTVDAAGAISYRDADGFSVTGIATTNTVNLVAGDVITQTGAMAGSSLSAKTLNNSGADINLSNTGNALSVINLSSRNALDTADAAGTLTYRDSGALDIASIATTGTASITALSLLQSGAISANAFIGKTLNNAGGDITLTNSGNAVASIDLRTRNAADNANAAGAITYSQANGFDIAALATTLTIDLTAGDAITQTGTITGATLFTAKTLKNGGADITLLNAGNSVTAIDLRSRNAADTANEAGILSFRDANALDIANIVTTATTNLTATSLTQSGTITADSLIAKTLNNAGGVITFDNAGNTVNTIDLRARNAADTANDTGAIIYTGANGFDIATIGTASTATLTAGANITDSGNITATTLTTNSIGGTVLDFGHSVTGFAATNSGSGDIFLDVSSPATLTLNDITQSGGGIVNISNAGGITVNGTTDTGNGALTLNALGNMVLNTTGILNAGLGNATLTATGTVSDGAGSAILANLLSVTTLNNAGNNITLDSGNHDVTTVNLQVRNAADTADAVGTIDFRALNGFDVAAANTVGTVTLTGGDALTQSGSMTGTTLLARTYNDAGADIDFSNSSNLFSSINLQSRDASDTVDAAGNITYTDSAGINITSLRTLGDATLTTNGIITDSGTIIVGGLLTTTSVGGFVLNNISEINAIDSVNSGAGNISFSNNGVPLTIYGLDQSGTGTIAFSNTGDVTVLSGATFVSNGGAITFTVNSGSLVVGNGASVNSDGGNIAITAQNLNINASGEINSGSGNTSITLNVAGDSIGLGNATGTLTLTGNELHRITANNLTLNAASNGDILVDGVTLTNIANIDGTVILQAINGTLGHIIFQNNPSTFKALSASADNGITVGAGAGITTTVDGLTLNGDAGGGVGGSDNITLNSNLISAGAITLSAPSGGIILAAPINLDGNGITINSNITGSGNSLVINAGTGTARFGSASIANLTVDGNLIAVNGGADVVTTGDQVYNAPIDFGGNTTMTASNFTFNDNIFGSGVSVTLNGQPGDNTFTINGTVGFNNLTVTGSGSNNILAVDAGVNTGWLIASANQGSLSGAGITGNFNFNNIQNLTGGNNGNTFTFNDGASVSGLIDGGNAGALNTLNYVAYSTPINVNLANTLYSGETYNSVDAVVTQFANITNVVGNDLGVLTLPNKFSTLNFTGSSNGFYDDPLFFSQFLSFATLDSSTVVMFDVPSVYNTLTNQLTVNGVQVQMSGFNPANFTGNITFIDSNPIPPIPPIPNNDASVARILSPYGQANMFADQSTVDALIVNNVGMMMNSNGFIVNSNNWAARQHSIASLYTRFGNKFYTMSNAKGTETLPLKEFGYRKLDVDLRPAFALLLSWMIIGLIITQLRKDNAVRRATQLREFDRYDIPSLSFELRSALNDIVGYTSLIDQMRMNPEQKELLSYVMSESNALLNNIERLEQQSRMDRQTMSDTAFKLRTALNNIIGFSAIMQSGEIGEVSKDEKDFLDNILTGSNKMLETIPID